MDIDSYFMTGLPSYAELDRSLNLPNPPVRVYSDDGLDKDLFERLDKQAKINTTTNHLSYASPEWNQDKILDPNLKNRVLELFSQSDQMGTEGYNIKTRTKGIYKGQEVVCKYNGTVTANELLPIIKPKNDKYTG